MKGNLSKKRAFVNSREYINELFEDIISDVFVVHGEITGVETAVMNENYDSLKSAVLSNKVIMISIGEWRFPCINSYLSENGETEFIKLEAIAEEQKWRYQVNTNGSVTYKAEKLGSGGNSDENYEKSEYKTDILGDDGSLKDFDGDLDAYPTAQSTVKALKQVDERVKDRSLKPLQLKYSISGNYAKLTHLNGDSLGWLEISLAGAEYRNIYLYADASFGENDKKDLIVINYGSEYINMSTQPYITATDGEYMYKFTLGADSEKIPVTKKKLIFEDTITEFETTINNIKNTYNEAHWDSIQNGGQRRDYSYAFTKWTGSEITPLYPIIAEKLMYTFMDCVNAADLSNISITLTGENPNMMYAFANCLLLEALPEILYDETVKAVRVMTSLYANCTKLASAKIYFGDGSVNPIEIRNNMQNAFYKCESIEEIEFSGKGSPIGLDLSPCTRLTKNSLISLSNVLMDVSGAEAGEYEIKVAEESLALLSEDEIKIFNDLGWNLIV